MIAKIQEPLQNNPEARCVWSSESKTHWVEHVWFRRTFQLNNHPVQGRIALYASTEYHLRVNGQIVGTGPVRGYADAPQYDTYDITALLGEGPNTIAVEVQHIGYATFQHQPKPPAFIAWGNVTIDNNITIDLSTPGEWECQHSKAHDPFPPRFSFSLGPVMIFDARKAPQNWDKSCEATGNWTPPVPAPDIDKWGLFTPREIPHLAQNVRYPYRILGAWKHIPLQIRGIRAFNTYEPNLTRAPKKCFVASTWVHTPQVCEIKVLSRWSDWIINGEPAEKQDDGPTKEKAIWKLNSGWNFLVFYGGTVLGTTELQCAFPAGTQLHFSAEKDIKGEENCRISPPLEENELEKILASVTKDSISGEMEWKSKAFDTNGSSPILNLAWPEFSEKLTIPKSQQDTIEIPPAQDTSLIFDLGVVTLGRIFIEFEAAEGTIIDIAYAEEMRDDRPAHYKMALVNSGERHIARSGWQRMETFCPRGSRFIQVGILQADAPVRIHRMGMVEAMYPYDFKGRFRCSDPRINDLWERGRWTLQICSEDVVVDTPWRERGLYGGDSLAEFGTMLATTGDGRLIRRCVDIYFQTQDPQTGWMPGRAPNDRKNDGLDDYALLVLLAAEWYCRWFKDKDFARRIAEPARRLIDGLRSRQTENGLYKASKIFVAHAYQYKNPENALLSTFNALAVRSFEAWASLQNMIGEDPTQARKEVKALSEKFNQYFWDNTHKCFIDHLNDDGSTIGQTLYANAWALLFADPENQQIQGAFKRISEALETFDPATECVSPYGSFYVLGALYRHGNCQLAERLIETVYAGMLEYQTGTIWEQSYPDKTISHAWSTAPTYYATACMAGVQLGWPFHENPDKIRIAPRFHSLTWAEACVPHPKGQVHIRWEKTGNRFFLDYKAPEGVEVEVIRDKTLSDCEWFINTK